MFEDVRKEEVQLLNRNLFSRKIILKKKHSGHFLSGPRAVLDYLHPDLQTKALLTDFRDFKDFQDFTTDFKTCVEKPSKC